jgi:hypothetical protein
MVNAELLHARLKATLGPNCIPMDQFVWVDEGKVGTWTDRFGNPWPYTMILALSSSGVVVFETIKGFVSTEKFLAFVGRNLVCLFNCYFTFHV